MSYITDNFMLKNKTAQTLYFNYAKDMPIFDYHCHLSEKQIAENKRFDNVFSLFLAGDHYKWRLMRNFGIDEKYITGDATDKEKFMAYCKALETAFGNPLYHWTQLELKEYFNCELEINSANAETIWNWCNDFIALNDLTPQKVIERSNVSRLFTTNEPFDDLSVFDEIEKKGYAFKVAPAFRADKLMNVDADIFAGYVNEKAKVNTFSELLTVIEEKLKAFIEKGCVAADIAVQKTDINFDESKASSAFDKRMSGKELSAEEIADYKGYVTYFLMKLYCKYGIVTELHMGATRNNNTGMFKRLGADTGFDAMSDENSINALTLLFDKLDRENSLPKTILFNLNPKMNMEIVTLLGCFQSSEAKGKIQYGASWWFLDNKEYISRHLRDLSTGGHIDTFVGMLTDSRSFLSYTRHHYFRRILCSFLGELCENGEITSDMELIGKVVKDISCDNAMNYFFTK